MFVGGYLLTWAAAGLAAFAVGAAGSAVAGTSLEWNHAGRVLAGVTLLVAAGYQLSPLKDVCLGKCRSPLGMLFGSWRDGESGALRMGMKNGAWCVGCCWALMASLFALGVMSVLWMAVVAGLIAIEKTVPWGRAGHLRHGDRLAGARRHVPGRPLRHTRPDHPTQRRDVADAGDGLLARIPRSNGRTARTEPAASGPRAIVADGTCSLVFNGTVATVIEPWEVAGSYFEACNCDAVCPCRRVDGRAGGRSTHGVCQFALSWQISRGVAGALPLDGLAVVMAGWYETTTMSTAHLGGSFCMWTRAQTASSTTR